MEVRINNEVVDAQIENEENAYQVVRQIDEWILGEGFFISSILINGEATSPSDEPRLSSVSIESVEILDIQALPMNELSYERFSTLLNYFILLYRAVKEEKRDLTAELLAELAPVLTNMDAILDLKVGGRPASEALKELLDRSHVLEGEISAIPELGEFLRNLCIYIEGRIREIVQPMGELKAAAAMMESQIGKLEDVPILLQTGKEREAMDLVISFTEVAEKLNRLYPLIQASDQGNIMSGTIGETPFKEFYTEFNARLGELIEAMEAEDSILIGDLLEYEIAPKMSELSAAIDKLPVTAGSEA